MSTPQKVVVIGQGYVGLPVAMRAVDAGFVVIGLDIDERRVRALARGESFVEDISGAELAEALGSGRYTPTTSYDEARGFDIAVISVPTPLRESLPDLTFIEEAGRSLAEHLTPGATVILESTTYPGTTEELLVPILESGSGLRAGDDFYVGYSPERIDPGNQKWNLQTTPKVVSGINPPSLQRVQAFFDRIVDRTVPVSGTREAELTKLLENTFRHVNIALVNELAVFANQLGVNVWESIDAAATKPFGFMKFTPGPGVGGHCLPVDPSYLSWQVRRELGKSFRFVELANDINEHMPSYVVERSIDLLNADRKAVNGSKIILVGLSYKKNTGDVREAPAKRIIELLTQLGAEVSAADPHVSEHQWPAATTRIDLNREGIDSFDLAIVVTDHDEFDVSRLTAGSTPVLDTRNVLHGDNVTRL
ncbi:MULTISPECIES: nucleotide sugar dehydrogenase [unclassified Microbacterium]|uniref:nucleotide sugar dehydrogenase n=1 Tax=unclassified Microbacterium TaxID=2609290 RepID=UPI001604C6FD|nr:MULTISPECIES: nucleotide sugar dehydrogenase [unclassified Microbacterium]QNA91993.1 nucleotide sugar dehydrogenase [Microbacterium sp. Se63.02b]QYM65223.1 nucleotide sugar dehydrogenase [Microbacterium sp. Se5.02b]